MSPRIIALLALVSPLLAGVARAEEGRHFNIDEFEVRGNTLLDQTAIERAVYPFMGEAKTADDVYAARDALLARYRDAGYPAVSIDVPAEQNPASGIIRLVISESKVDDVTVTGARFFSPRDIRQELPALQTGAPMNAPLVRAEVNRLNRANPDLNVTPVLRGGATPGSVEVELKVKDELPAHASMELNNRYTAETTHQRGVLSLSYGNLWQMNHRASLTYQFSPENMDEVQVLVGSYLMPIGEGADKLAFYAVDSESSSRPAGVLSVLGKGTVIGSRWVHPIEPMPGYLHSLSLGFDYKDFSDAINLDSSTGIETPIDYVNWLLEYSGTKTGATAEGEMQPAYETSFTISANMGVRDLGNDVDEFQSKADGAKPDYFYLRENVEHTQRLPWELSAHARLEAQQTGRTLISNEQYSVGGVDTVRGYEESAISGDSGQSLQLELRSMPLLQGQWLINELSLYSFRDWGRTRLSTRLPTVGQAREERLASYGLGVRMDGFDCLSMEAAWAYALLDGGHVSRGDDRIHFSVKCAF